MTSNEFASDVLRASTSTCRNTFFSVTLIVMLNVSRNALTIRCEVVRGRRAPMLLTLGL